MAYSDAPIAYIPRHSHAEDHAPQAQISINPETVLNQENHADENKNSDLTSARSSPAHDDDASLLPQQHAEGAITPISLLIYLSKMKEAELYYYLFNQVNIVTIADNKLEVSREGADKSLNSRLAEILFTWTGIKWSVIITDTSDQQSLKEKMKARFMESEEWKMLQDYSRGITLTDIILD